MTPRQTRKDSKEGKKRLHGREKDSSKASKKIHLPRQARHDSKAGKKRLKGRQEKTPNKADKT